MRGFAAVACALAGCDGALGLHGAVAADAQHAMCATAPAGSLDCHTTSPFLCADFDESPLVVFANGVPVAPPYTPPPDVVVGLEPDGAPNFACIDSGAGGAYAIDDTPSTGSFHTMHATFAVNIARYGNGIAPTSFFEIGLRNPAYDHCYADLFIDEVNAIEVESHCASPTQYAHAVVVSGVPPDWFDVIFDINVTAGTATVQIGSPVVTLIMGPTNIGAGTPHTAFGVVPKAPSNPGAAVGFDDVQVTASN